ncbi:MAG: LysM peptidoglycan-binding domain-containing protein [Clostridia bacterium]|nr:LysM peptidoglycan-binding domain-containing protein [Clostridia bacterium]
MEIYVVKQGDTIYKIAEMFNVSAEKIIADNELTENAVNNLVVGQTLVIMLENSTHTVVSGDTLFKIAKQYNVSLSDLTKANPQITNPLNLTIGSVINIPKLATNKREIEVNGYCFPNISREVLSKTLPSLTYLSIFSYEVYPNGNLNNLNNDTVLIELARQNNVAPMMVVTNIEEGASFSSELAHQVLSSPVNQANLINNILTTMQQKNYYGVDIDFEYLYPEDRELYNQFLQALSLAIKPQGFILTTAVAPKTSSNQEGILYEAHDYAFHGRVSDHVIIMTYEWGYTYSAPRAVAPAPEVKRVLDYAVTQIPSQKILMGMPNYGYDWNVPYVEGTAASAISNTGAVNLAREVGSFINYSTSEQAPYFNYYTPNQQHEVWFDDANSVKTRLQFVSDYNLGGVSYWTINSYFPQNWLVLNAMYNVKKLV